MTLSVNGEPMQDGNTSQMIFSIAEQIAYLSRILLQPGDLIATGTPDGVGMSRGVYLKPGDDDGVGGRHRRHREPGRLGKPIAATASQPDGDGAGSRPARK